MKVTFLGTGTSSGVPMVACNCAVCCSVNSKDKRLRTSILISNDNESYAIDSGPDFRQQMLANNVKQLHGIVYTHEHIDHTGGLDDIRGYNHFMQQPMNLFASKTVQAAIQKQFYYIFTENKYPGIPQVNFKEIEAGKKFYLGSLAVQPIEVMHLKMAVLGFRINDFTYITDANFINESEIEKIKGTKILVLNALRIQKHISHFSLSEAIAFAQYIGAEKTYFTHISHQLGLHDDVQKILPENMFLAYDGLQINCDYINSNYKIAQTIL